MLYGAETMAISSADRRILNVFQMNCLKSLVGVIRKYRIKNKEIIEELEWK